MDPGADPIIKQLVGAGKGLPESERVEALVREALARQPPEQGAWEPKVLAALEELRRQDTLSRVRAATEVLARQAAQEGASGEPRADAAEEQSDSGESKPSTSPAGKKKKAEE